MCLSTRFPGDALLLVQGPHLREPVGLKAQYIVQHQHRQQVSHPEGGQRSSEKPKLKLLQAGCMGFLSCAGQATREEAERQVTRTWGAECDRKAVKNSGRNYRIRPLTGFVDFSCSGR